MARSPTGRLCRSMLTLLPVALAIATVQASTGGQTSNGKDSNSKLVANKVGALFAFFAVSFVGCWIPFFINVSMDFLKYGTLYSAGIFFAVALLEMTKEAYENLETAAGSSYPWGFMVVACGFMATWLADATMKAIWDRRSEIVAKAARKSSSTRELVTLESGEGENKKDDDEGGLGSIPAVAKDLTILDVAVLLLALCFHASLEGLAVGLTSTVFSCWNLTGSILINEFFEGLALGTTLKAQDKDRRWFNFSMYAIPASITAPIGIAVGIVLDQNVNESALAYVKGIGFGLAGGVFIFVAVSNLIAKALRPGPNDRWWTHYVKWACTAAGVTTSCLVAIKGEGE